MKQKKTVEELYSILQDISDRAYDGVKRTVSSSDDIEADGLPWAVVSDHGNVEIGYRGRNGRLYWIGGLV